MSLPPQQHPVAAETLRRFASALDAQAFDKAIGLFTENAEYSVFLRHNYEHSGVLSLISEDVPALRNRCSMHRTGPLDVVRHVVGLADISPGKEQDIVTATANFTASYSGRHVFAGEYRAQLKNVGGDWLIDQLLVLLDGDHVPAAIRTPI